MEGCGRLLLVTLLISLTVAYEEIHGGYYTDEFGVQIDGDLQDLEQLAREHGLTIQRQIRSLGNVYVLSHESLSRRSKRNAEDIISILAEDPRIKVAEQQVVLTRTKRRIVHDKQWELPIKHYRDKSMYQRYTDESSRLHTKDDIPGATGKIAEANFNDPYFPDQWYLINEGQTGGKEGYDVNVFPVWQNGITGSGVVVSILDDGIDHNHPDLQENYDQEASADMNDRRDRQNDPMPNDKDSRNSHGTRCAGEVAAQANNSNCGVGIAFNAKIGGVRMLDGTVTDMLEAEALTYNNQHIDIYSASWGPSDNGKTIEGPGKFASRALETGITEGRGGKGSIYVWATGNGGMVDDDCSCDGYVSSIYTLSVGCISDRGLSTYFSEMCPSTMAVIFTGGAQEAPGSGHPQDNPRIKVVTTDLNGDCTLEFQGTSSAAPLAAGCFALVLEANPDLTWRDLQNIVVHTARIPNSEEEGWTVNGAGYHVNHRFGFGAIDCGKMVEVGQTWQTVPEQHKCVVEPYNAQVDITAGGTVNQTLMADGCQSSPHDRVVRLEHVQVHVELTHKKRGDLSINLYSPSGTHSEILSLRPLDDSADGLKFTFMTVHNWGEDPSGAWTLSVSDMSHRPLKHGDTRGKLKSWSLILWGWGEDKADHSAKRDDEDEEPTRETAHAAEEPELEHIMAEEEVLSENLQIEDRSGDEDRDLASLNEHDIRILRELFEDAEDAQEEKSREANRRRKNFRSRYMKGLDSGHQYRDRKRIAKKTLEEPIHLDEEMDVDALIEALREVLDESKSEPSAPQARQKTSSNKDMDAILSEMDELLQILDDDKGVF